MMNRELIRMFIHRQRLLAVGLAAGAAVLVLGLTALFPDADLANARYIARSWPPLMKNLFGDPITSFTNIYGWLNLQLYHITYWVIFGVYASLLASSIIVVEIEGKTIDLLLSCAVPRIQIVVSRLAALIVVLAGSTLPVTIGCLLGLHLADHPIQLAALLEVYVSGLTLCLVCAGLTLFISTIISARIPAMIVSWCILSVLFFINEVLVKLVAGLDLLAAISPFRYYRTSEILVEHLFRWQDPILLLAAFAGLSLLATLHFARKDIYL